MAWSLAVKPRAARRAASRPFMAALPAWNGLVMVPKLTFKPAACDAAMPRAFAVCPASSPMSLAAAAAAPNVPMVPVAWNPAS